MKKNSSDLASLLQSFNSDAWRLLTESEKAEFDKLIASLPSPDPTAVLETIPLSVRIEMKDVHDVYKEMGKVASHEDVLAALPEHAAWITDAFRCGHWRGPVEKQPWEEISPTVTPPTKPAPAKEETRPAQAQEPAVVPALPGLTRKPVPEAVVRMRIDAEAANAFGVPHWKWKRIRL